MEQWVNFFKPFFPTSAETEAWVARCEALAPPNNHAKIMMHQAQRLISIADDLPQIRRHAESLQLMFYMVCAEHLAKLHDKFDGEGRSREYVCRFFRNFVIGDDRNTLAAAFTNHTDHLMRSLPFDRAVDMLYRIRCDVVHEGNYWGFAFHDGSRPTTNTDPDVIAKIQLNDLRAIIVRGCINAVTERLNAP